MRWSEEADSLCVCVSISMEAVVIIATPLVVLRQGLRVGWFVLNSTPPVLKIREATQTRWMSTPSCSRSASFWNKSYGHEVTVTSSRLAFEQLHVFTKPSLATAALTDYFRSVRPKIRPFGAPHSWTAKASDFYQ